MRHMTAKLAQPDAQAWNCNTRYEWGGEHACMQSAVVRQLVMLPKAQLQALQTSMHHLTPTQALQGLGELPCINESGPVLAASSCCRACLRSCLPRWHAYRGMAP